MAATQSGKNRKNDAQANRHLLLQHVIHRTLPFPKAGAKIHAFPKPAKLTGHFFSKKMKEIR